MPAPRVEPSKYKANGKQKRRATMVTQLYKLSGDILLMSFLEKMARAEKATLELIAVKKPNQVKESSVAEAMATPTITGKRER